MDLFVHRNLHRCRNGGEELVLTILGCNWGGGGEEPEDETLPCLKGVNPRGRDQHMKICVDRITPELRQEPKGESGGEYVLLDFFYLASICLRFGAMLHRRTETVNVVANVFNCLLQLGFDNSSLGLSMTSPRIILNINPFFSSSSVTTRL